MTNIHGNKTIVLVDSDVVIGLIHDKDALHERSTGVLKTLEEQSISTFIPFPTVLESATALSRVVNRPDLAKRLLERYALMSQPSIIETDIRKIIAQLFNPKGSKKNTPFDYYLLALAKRNNISIIFSFDMFYKKNGLVLAEELLEK